jgi:hypothetical protein
MQSSYILDIETANPPECEVLCTKLVNAMHRSSAHYITAQQRVP